MTELDPDVPYSEDLQSADGARAWTDLADRKRPLRVRIRSAIVDRLQALPPGARVLELGSGPGLLAEQALHGCPNIAEYTLFDFSQPMLQMSRDRVGRSPVASFVLGDFRTPGWTDLLAGPYDAVVSMQSAHEVRHKRHVPRLYRQICRLLAPSGVFLICDRVPEDPSPRSTALFMTEEEQMHALVDAGFVDVRLVLSGDALALCQCRPRTSGG